jgi:hypothetical protein
MNGMTEIDDLRERLREQQWGGERTSISLDALRDLIGAYDAYHAARRGEGSRGEQAEQPAIDETSIPSTTGAAILKAGRFDGSSDHSLRTIRVYVSKGWLRRLTNEDGRPDGWEVTDAGRQALERADG